MDFKDATVWLSNPWYVAAPVEIRNFTLDGNPLPDSYSTTQQPVDIMGRPKLAEFSGDAFNMKPLSVGCQSSWKIDCVVASCSLDLQRKNPDTYERYCKVNTPMIFYPVSLHCRRYSLYITSISYRLYHIVQ